MPFRLALKLETKRSPNDFGISYFTPQEERHGLFHSQGCFYEWHQNHRNEIERLIRDMGDWKNPS